MFDRVVMDVIEVVGKHLVIVHYFFPKASLPYVTFAMFLARPGNVDGAMAYTSK